MLISCLLLARYLLVTFSLLARYLLVYLFVYLLGSSTLLNRLRARLLSRYFFPYLFVTSRITLLINSLVTFSLTYRYFHLTRSSLYSSRYFVTGTLLTRIKKREMVKGVNPLGSLSRLSAVRKTLAGHTCSHQSSLGLVTKRG